MIFLKLLFQLGSFIKWFAPISFAKPLTSFFSPKAYFPPTPSATSAPILGISNVSEPATSSTVGLVGFSALVGVFRVLGTKLPISESNWCLNSVSMA